MIEEMGEVSLKGGMKLKVARLVPPVEGDEGEDLKKMVEFLRGYMVPEWLRERELDAMLEERLKGRDLEWLRHSYFLGWLDGQIATYAEYTTPSDNKDVGLLGPIFTIPSLRKQGASSATLDILCKAFEAEGGLFLCAEAENEGEEHALAKVGFREVHADPFGYMWYVGGGHSLEKSVEDYFQRDGDCEVRSLNIADGLREPPLTLAAKQWILSMGFGSITELVEEQAASRILNDEAGPFAEVLTGILNDKGRLVGTACLARHEVMDVMLSPHVLWLDFHVHPFYVDMVEEMLMACFDEAYKRDARWVYALVPKEEEDKVACLAGSGFEESCTLRKYLAVREELWDVALLVKELGREE